MGIGGESRLPSGWHRGEAHCDKGDDRRSTAMAKRPSGRWRRYCVLGGETDKESANEEWGCAGGPGPHFESHVGFVRFIPGPWGLRGIEVD
jgi:hypothetical protein